MRKYLTLEPSTLMEEECRGIYPLIKKIHLLAQSFIHLINISFIFISNFANTVIFQNPILLYYIGFNIHHLNISGTRRRQPRRQQTQDGGRAVDEETS